MAHANTFEVTFEITGIPNSAGLRIKSSKPVGLYVSSLNAGAAQFYFAALAVSLIRAEIFTFQEEHLPVFHNEILWDAFVNVGKGSINFTTIPEGSAGQMISEIERGEMEKIEAPVKLHVSEWTLQSGKTVYIVRDPGNTVDSWFVECVKADIELIRS